MSDNPPLARRMPGFDARHATRRARRLRVGIVTVVIVAVVAVGAVVAVSKLRHHRAPRRTAPPAPATPALETSLAPWRLQAPISDAVVLPGAGADQLVIAGGSTAGGLTASGVFVLDTTNGALSQVADLAGPLDDASGARVAGRDVVFGGASSSGSSPSAAVQELPASLVPVATGVAAPVATALGTLPQPRAEASAVSAGATAYLVGGEDAAGPDPSVLATSDGQHFTTLATLAVPVLSPGVAVVGTALFVFGGVAVTGPDAGLPVDTVQEVDLRTRRTTVVGTLPVPLGAPAAVALGDAVFVAGGDTRATAGTPTTSIPGSTTTPGSSLTTVGTVWYFDPHTHHATAVGTLATPVAHAALAEVGGRAWLVGGESDGTPQSVVQSFTLSPGARRTGRTASSTSRP